LLRKFTTRALKCDRDGNLLIHFVCKRNQLRTVKDLLSRCLSEYLNRNGQNILHVLAKCAIFSATKYILRSPKAEKLVNEKDSDGNTPLLVATMNWQSEILFLRMRDARVDLKAVTKTCFTAFDIAQGALE